MEMPTNQLQEAKIDIAILQNDVAGVKSEVMEVKSDIVDLKTNHLAHIAADIKTVLQVQQEQGKIQQKHSEKFVHYDTKVIEWDTTKKIILGAIGFIIALIPLVALFLNHK